MNLHLTGKETTGSNVRLLPTKQQTEDPVIVVASDDSEFSLPKGLPRTFDSKGRDDTSKVWLKGIEMFPVMFDYPDQTHNRIARYNAIVYLRTRSKVGWSVDKIASLPPEEQRDRRILSSGHPVAN